MKGAIKPITCFIGVIVCVLLYAPTITGRTQQAIAACSKCQGIADAIADLRSKRASLVREIEALETRVDLRRQAANERFAAWQNAPKMTPEAKRKELEAAYDQANDQRHDDELALAQDKRRLAEFDKTIGDLLKQLATCNASCSTSAAPGTNPGITTPAPGHSRVCPGCEAIGSLVDAARAELARLDALDAPIRARLKAIRAEYDKLYERKKQAEPESPAAQQLESQMDKLDDEMESLDIRIDSIANAAIEARDHLDFLLEQLEACEARCVESGGASAPPELLGPKPTTAVPSTDPKPTEPKTEPKTEPTPPDSPKPPESPKPGNLPGSPKTASSDGAGTSPFLCVLTDSCPPVDTDGSVPGNFPYPGGLPYVTLTDGNPWITSGKAVIEIRIQIKLVDVIDPSSYPDYSRLMTFSQNMSGNRLFPMLPSDALQIWIPPTMRQGVEKWFNPLGLLARRLIDNLERWRGSVGPRPLIRSGDLEFIDRVSDVQAAGLPAGVHVLLTDQGGSTGRTLAMQILNLTGAPVALSSRSFAVQPIQQQTQQRVQQAFSRLAQAAPARLDLNAYCVEFLKLPPGPNTLFRLAPADVQQKYASMSKILQSAYRVSKANALHPDSNPAAYTDAMKQWSIWAVEQNLNEARFTEAFLGHTKKNVEAAKQQWSKQADDMIRAATPNRWRDIVKILHGAGVPVPR